MVTPADPVARTLERWRNNLIDLTRRNPLLALKPNRTSYLEILQPELARVCAHLLQGKNWLFYLPATNDRNAKKNSKKELPAPRATELVTTETDRQALVQILTNLYRRALTDYRERGLHLLHLALGVLEWRDEEEETFRSPVLLLPVKLERHSLKDPFSLRAVEDEPILNPALAARLRQDFDFRLPPTPPDWEEKTPLGYLEELKSSISGLPGWEVREDVLLTLFSFFKGVIFQDLQENAEQVRAHPLIQTLAGLPARLARVESLEEKELDDRQDPQSTYHILDADGSQRLCLEAATRGESFVLIGPPGTGKSQTIANLIADQTARGKKVLFVSEKMAALEVVYQRLCQVGLGEFCLELHSHKANKREVIQELARCLEEVVPQTLPSPEDFARLQGRRDQLNRYIRALHQKRAPMGKSVWEALDDMARWQALPQMPLGLPAVRPSGDTTTKLVVSEFTSAHLDELKQLLQRLQHHWHLRTDRNYPWRGFKAERYSLQLRDEIVSLIDRIRARGDKLRQAAANYARELGVQGTIVGLLRLGDLLEKRPAHTLVDWLMTPDFAGLSSDFEKCASQYQRLGQARQPLTERYGAALWKQAPGTAVRIVQAWQQALPLLASTPLDRSEESGADFLKMQPKLRAWAADTQKRIPGWLTELRTLEKWLYLPLPIGAGSSTSAAAHELKLDPSVRSLRGILRLANLSVSDAPPDRTWLEDRHLLKEVQEIIASSRAAFIRYKQNRQYLMQIYNEKLFRLDLVRIAHAYAGWYRNWLCIFSWQYRKDRRAIAKCRPSEVVPATVAHDMQRGAEVQTDRAQLEADQPRRSKLLGRYEKGLDTEIELADRAARHAAEALEVARNLECEPWPTKCLEALTSGSPPEKIRAAIKRCNESFAAWSHLTQELSTILPQAQLPQVGEPLEECSLSALLQYARDLQAALNQFATLADPLLATAPAVDMRSFARDLHQAEELLAWEASQATEAERWTARFGPVFQGVNTDWDSLRKAILWTGRLRESLGTLQGAPAPSASSESAKMPLVHGEHLLKATTSTPPSSRELRHALEPYEHALHSLEIRYDAPGPQLDGKVLREHAPEIVLDLLNQWRDRVGELSDWVDWRYLPERFHHLGLKSFWDHLQQHEIVLEDVIDLFLKSFWSAWIDAMFQQDPVLHEYRRSEHEQHLQEFRELDRRLIQQTGDRIKAVLIPARARRGEETELALLMKEAHKKTKHLPLRQLFDSMPALLLQLKPCILMSPLSVSQFLPAESHKLHFDLVVFDEASQILPEDAIGAIYRGKQLVITGDNQQLPPTTFFQQNADEGPEEETERPLFESILDACLGAGLPRKMLRWHYRSQHEDLIAFSNASYYGNRLVTFPSAVFHHPDLGVQMLQVTDGIYDRGGLRNNLREAQIVAQRVLEHYRRSPERTLGVIAFSYAQMNAIEDELEQQLREAPELEPLLKSDRLEGFFVKNLETVQGDERDVILLSIGYGRDAQGKIELNFGPLNREGGERRLNVAVTRARQQLIVVSSIRARDLNLNASSATGLAHLQRYLEFAEHGMESLRPESGNGDLSHAGLHADVMRVLKELGYDSVPFVGCGPCRVDLGVRDPRQAGQFLLGIEFDGPMVAQAATARDRDRIRPEVLTRLGWKQHRIGAPDWIYRKEEEILRLRQALSIVPGLGQ